MEMICRRIGIHEDIFLSHCDCGRESAIGKVVETLLMDLCAKRAETARQWGKSV